MITLETLKQIPVNSTPNWGELVELQKSLLVHYISLEKLPQYPIDISTKENQVTIKYMVDRIVEELIESLEQRVMLLEILKTQPLQEVRENKLLQYVMGFNEEVGDTLHFMIEAMIYLGISPTELEGAYHYHISQTPQLHGIWDNNIDLLSNIMRLSTVTVGIHQAEELSWKLSIMPYTDLFNMGGRYYSPTYNMLVENMILRVIYLLNLFKNKLKNRLWKKQEVTSNVEEATDLFLRAVEHYFYLLSVLGFTDESIQRVFTVVNFKNNQRIKTGE